MIYLQLVEKFITEEEGATGIEYALFASLIAAVVIASVQALCGSINATYVEALGQLTAAMGS
jgi:pilus assembly protein Flp/PilA